MAVFRPPYVEQGFQQHYTSTTLAHVDRISLPADILIWAVGLLSTWHTPLGTLCAAPPLAFAVGCTLWRHTCHEEYLRHRTAITAMRRLTIYPYLTLVYLAQRPPQAAASPLAAFVHLFVLSGSFVVCAAALMLNHWWAALWEVPVSVAAFAATAPISCRNILAGPQPYAGWRAAAELMDATALNIYSSSLQDSAVEHAVCCTTLNTMLVTCCCVAAFCVYCFERQARLRYKAQLPPDLAAMQGRLHPLPPDLLVAQGLLLVAHPVMILGWLSFGAWHGLRQQVSDTLFGRVLSYVL